MENFNPATVARNREIIKRIAEAFSTGNPALLDEIVAKDIIIHTPDPWVEGNGIELIKNQIRTYSRAFPDMAVTIDQIVADNDIVAAWYTVTGTQTADLPDIPATNRKVRVNAVDMYTIRNGKAVEFRGLFDAMQLLEQLGVTAQPANAATMRR